MRSSADAQVRRSNFSCSRLINFLDFRQRVGARRERAEVSAPILNQYLVNVPHEFFKVYGLGDMYSPKNVSVPQPIDETTER